MNEEIKIQKMPKSIPVSTVVIISAFIFAVGLGVGSAFDIFKTTIGSTIGTTITNISTGNQDFSLYWNAYKVLQNKYVDQSKLDKDTLYYGTIKGMVAAIGDPATVFLDPKETQSYNDARGGVYQGIGAELDSVNQQIIVVAPFAGSPAEKAGLRGGDIIVEVNTESVSGKSVAEVVLKIRGEANTEVTLNIIRPKESNKAYTLKIMRGTISAPSMALKEIKDKTAVVTISRFTEATFSGWTGKWDSITTDLQSKIANGQVKNIVLDLRGNPGGFLDAAVYLAQDFVPKGSVVVKQRDRNNKDESTVTYRDPRLGSVPLIVLVNGNSASASEIFSGAIKHYKRGIILGEKTYGKGTAQEVLNLSSGSSIHVTVTKWLLPDGTWINKENPVVPDKVITFDTKINDTTGADNQLDEALKLLK